MEELAKKNWDIFISYASEDRQAVAIPLAKALSDQGLKVWFDQYELAAGDSLFESIGGGIGKSKNALVILSPTYFTKSWAQNELKNIYSLKTSGEIVKIIPIWYNLTAKDISNYAPLLSDFVALQWEYGLDIVVQSVIAAIYAEKGDLLIPVPYLISGELRQSLSRNDYQRLVKKMVIQHGEENVNATLKSLLIDFDQTVWIRLRAAEQLDQYGIIDPDSWTELLQQPIPDLLSGLIDILIDSDYQLSEEQIEFLVSSKFLPVREKRNIGNVIESMIKRGGSISTGIFAPLAKLKNPWEIRLNCVRAIIRLDDHKSLETLYFFRTTTYWIARLKTAEYILEKFEQNKLNPGNKKLSLEILSYYLNDGKTNPRTKTMRVTQEVYNQLSEEKIG